VAGERDDRYVACPYYLGLYSEEQRKRCQIRCEGVSKGNTISLVFGDENVRKAYKKAYCYSINMCKECLIHQMLNRKYGVEDDAI
jgi:hypothetical protein